MRRLPPISGGGGRRRCRRGRRRSPAEVIADGRARRPGAGEVPAVGGGQARGLRGVGLGLELVPEVVLHPSVTERFTRCAPGLSAVARRTLRTNLRFIGRRVVPQLYPADLPLPRERAKAPYSLAEIAGFLALADAQPTAERRMRAAGLVCLGAGAGLIRGDLRDGARQRRGLPLRRRDRAGQRPAPARGAGASPATMPGCWRRPGSPGRPDLPAAPIPAAGTSRTR